MKTSLKKAVELVEGEFNLYALQLKTSSSISNVKYYFWQMKGYLRALSDYNVITGSDYLDYIYRAREMKYNRMEELE